MFEFSIASKYLLPQSKQLSVSIISLISIFVIALVVWLIVVFFSITNGLEKAWVQKLIALTAPVRITPTPEYYDSYYYQIDFLSEESHYAAKSIKEKLESEKTDPYNEMSDEEIPSSLLQALRNKDQSLKDLVKEVFSSVQEIKGLQASEYELAVANLKIKLRRFNEQEQTLVESILTQTVYLGSVDNEEYSSSLLLPLDDRDKENQQYVTSLSSLHCIKNFFGNKEDTPFFVQKNEKQLETLFLPKTFKDAGVLAGDKASLSYYKETPSALQEQYVEVIIAGFYDPGIIPMAGKYALASKDLISTIRCSSSTDEIAAGNGINVYMSDFSNAALVKKELEKKFHERGIDKYWKIETFREFDFTKDLLQQLQSDKYLFMLIAVVIMIVACSNIISMLVILVNDKKLEIGILRSMGATSLHIAFIFGFCGFTIGIVGSLLGTLGAFLTLKNIESLVHILSQLQGYPAFNPLFYGSVLPKEMSIEALLFVILSTGSISLLSGIIPAVKACLLKPSAILKQ